MNCAELATKPALIQTMFYWQIRKRPLKKKTTQQQSQVGIWQE